MASPNFFNRKRHISPPPFIVKVPKPMSIQYVTCLFRFYVVSQAIKKVFALDFQQLCCNWNSWSLFNNNLLFRPKAEFDDRVFELAIDRTQSINYLKSKMREALEVYIYHITHPCIRCVIGRQL